MIKTQTTPTVNVTAATPLVTDFHTAGTPCLFCECGKTGADVCVTASAPRTLTITERETETGTRFAIGTASARDGRDFKPLRGHGNYTMPCAALAGAARISYELQMPVKPTLIAGVDWATIIAEVSARLYATGFTAYTASAGDAAGGWCQTEQRIYAGPVVATRTINIHPSRILDNEVTRQGWDAAAALEEADAVLGAENFSYDTDIDGAPVDSLAGVF